jgi:hypothetical protein
MGTNHSFRAGEGGREEGTGVHGGECVRLGQSCAIAEGSNGIQEEGLGGAFPFGNTYLTRLVQVSKGSWQPELWLEGFAAPNVDG